MYAEWGKLEWGAKRVQIVLHAEGKDVEGTERMLRERTYEAITRYWRGGAFEFFSEGNNVAALDCCRYKDNRAYPWPGGESHFILYPESANQTIYAQKVRASDAGRYSCRARNDTTILEGDITLAVLG